MSRTARLSTARWGTLDLLALAATLYVLAYLVWLIAPGEPFGIQRGLSDWSLLPLGAGAAAMMGAQARNPLLEVRTRRAWRLFAGTLALYLASDALWLSLGSPDISVADVGYLLSYLGFLAALLSFPDARGTDGDRLPFWLDVATVVLAGTMVMWQFVLGTLVLDSDALGFLEVFVAGAYPVADLVMLLGVAAALVRRGQDDSLKRALGGVAGGMLLLFGGDLLYSYQSLHDTYTAGGAADVVWGLAYYFLLAGAYLQHRDALHAPAAGPTARDLLGYRKTPYVALVVAYGLLLHASRDSWDRPLGGLVLGAVALTLVAAARQLRVMRENLRLHRATAHQRSEARFRALVRHSTDVISIVDSTGVIRYASPAVERTFGYQVEGLVGAPLRDFVHPDDAARVLDALLSPPASGDALPTVLYRFRHQDGGWRHVETTGSDGASDHDVGGIVLNTRDTTERVVLEEQLAYQAFHDPLTGLANRALFRDRLEHAILADARRHEGIAVLFLDLDDFKTINDTLGHSRGDLLLVAVARRLLSSTRGCDTVARLGGDEFAVLLTSVGEDGLAMTVAERILACLKAPFDLDGREIRIRGSLGVARSREGMDAGELLRSADLAMYEAKRSGKGDFALYVPEMHTVLVNRLEMEGELRRVVESRAPELSLKYQPILSLSTGQVVSVEALARWTHPQRGEISPAVFIPLAEESDLIIDLGRWILSEACHTAVAWQAVPRDGAPAGPSAPPAITVNISGRQLRHGGLVEDVQAALRASGLPPARLILEITETVLTDHSAAVIEQLAALRDLGVRIAIDDFGTGYSSLSYLQRLPVDILKIDKAFVDEITQRGKASAVARTIVALGASLALRIVAEGIEHPEQHAQLRELGCDFGQGYLFSRPVSADGMLALLRRPAALPLPGAA